MKSLKIKFREWLFDDTQPQAETIASGKLIRSVDSDFLDNEHHLDLRITNVVGGRLVTFREYDRAKDRVISRTHIITESENFEESLCKIIALETLRL